MANDFGTMSGPSSLNLSEEAKSNQEPSLKKEDDENDEMRDLVKFKS